MDVRVSKKTRFYSFINVFILACDCYAPGSASLVCNNATGQCECKSGAIGRQCNRCKIGKQDVSAGCIGRKKRNTSPFYIIK